MTNLKINKQSFMMLALVLVLFSGNTIILRYVTPLLYLIGFFSVLWNNKKQLKTNQHTKRIVSLYLWWILFLIINTVQSYDVGASITILQVFVIGGLFGCFSWHGNAVHTYMKFMRAFCLFFAFSIILQVIAPNVVLSLSNIIAPGRSGVIQNELYRGIYSGLTGEKAKAAYTMVVGVCVELAFYILNGKKFYKTNYLLILLYVLATMLTSKRMLCIIVLIEILIALNLFEFKGKAGKVLLGGILTIIVFCLLLIAIPQTNNIIMRFLDGAEDVSKGGRLMFWDYCVVMFKNKPLIGYGINTFNQAFSDNVGYMFQGSLWNMYAHSMYYELLGETGLFGVVLFCTFMIYSLVYSIRLFKICSYANSVWKSLLWFSISMQVLFIVYGYSGNVLYDKAQLFTYLSSVSMTIAASYNVIYERKLM